MVEVPHYCERPEKRWGACRRCCPPRWGVVGEVGVVGVVGVVGLEGAVHLGEATSVSYCLQLVPQIAHTIRAQSTHPSLPCSNTNKQATMLCFFMHLFNNINKKIGQFFWQNVAFVKALLHSNMILTETQLAAEWFGGWSKIVRKAVILRP